MQPLKQFWVAEALERDLGDPGNPDNMMSFKQVIDLDEKEEFPHEIINWLYNWKLQDYYIPTECGGEFTGFDEFISFVRVLSRRDQTAAIAFTTMFWSYLVWMAGTDEQKHTLSSFMKDANGTMCLAYSEKAHGSDLLGGDMQAKKASGGYILNGEKWPINRATISGVAFVLARTDDEGGARSLSLFMVEKSKIDQANYSHLPKILTHGVRGSDMSGIRFDNCYIPESMRLGAEGAGLELALKGFQITRALCAAFSQGAADTALRTTLKFALERKLYGKTVFDMPQPKRTLTDGFLDILICDCATIGVARGFNTMPEQISVWSAVVKYFVTTTLETTVQNVSVVLGSRFYMREAHDWGIFQKVLRDNAIISMFDGSTVVNLHALLLQLRQLAKSRVRNAVNNLEKLQTRLATTFDLTQPLPPFNGKKLELVNRGGDDVLQGLDLALTSLQHLKADSNLDPDILYQIITLTNIVQEELNTLDEQITASTFQFGHEQSPEVFDMAKQYCVMHVAAACVHTWLHNRNHLGKFFANGEWLALSLRKLMLAFRSAKALPGRIDDGAVTQELIRLYNQNKMFSIVPFQLANSTQQETTNDASPKLQLQA
ncbi:acyl-CoA dehydrogenase family protein [Anabaena cylindrica FACHB-243]|uniref:Acyl-CoA dehydrogenase domain-containing protein n=1 Tax=Anabaena cylindrica (strain ATCC 27899 / PCC 7122) TaxID=272123 RepID=K9ZKV6_ANACC|nr:MULTISPECIES: acyl-CoA dehydrogenase family protein [Anabaena]AFZ59873.1 acyl-CoA dehydrogenase domain-containing protein [Anabaena cylindrica PCC 7122]MBD2416702.1 acyl-CoA dehydrogenase family protein [Anabaena cylindrica FACHB-243]MBY5285002.1 acyl-CoA dehydrogenase family protein [Anabaena sp. CCAP 1446/1C]MBY5310361.1 acyl-CoA dehydrogenase family protein [Anabaena sp. CCAP 1446/1C]MCM2409877.1 acyl-CoA dehydrogenase family protein [Anabaena sp. CCAP 1446/1C]